jgi:hypothetical protein
LLADFSSVNDAAHAVSRIVATGIVPAALEMMDNATIRCVEASIYAAGYPVDAAAILLCEVDGVPDGLDDDVALIRDACMTSGARGVRVATEAADRLRLWQGRKKAFGAMGRLAPALVVQDAVVPRTKLPDVLAAIDAIGARHGVRVCNVFHAGDGNLHPNIPYNADDADESARVHAAMSEIMHACVRAGGTITGEHGVGLDKLPYMDSLFDAESLDEAVAQVALMPGAHDGAVEVRALEDRARRLEAQIAELKRVLEEKDQLVYAAESRLKDMTSRNQLSFQEKEEELYARVKNELFGQLAENFRRVEGELGQMKAQKVRLEEEIAEKVKGIEKVKEEDRGKERAQVEKMVEEHRRQIE